MNTHTRFIGFVLAGTAAFFFAAAPVFAQLKDIEIKVTRKRQESGTEKKTGHVRQIDTEITYNVEIKNLRFKPFGPLQVKYRIYYTDAKPGSTRDAEEKMAEGASDAPVIEAGKSFAFQTTPVKLSEEKLDSDWRWVGGADRTAADGVSGYWFKVFDAGGKLVGEHLSTPSLPKKKPW